MAVFRSEQPPYSMLTRAIEHDLLPTAIRHGLGVLSYRPLAGGGLSGTYRKGQEVDKPGATARTRNPASYDARNPANAAKLAAADALGEIADEAGFTLVQMATAFVARHPGSTSAILGPRTMDHLDGYLAADGVELTHDVLGGIDQVVRPGDTVDVADHYWQFGTAALQPTSMRR
jgi:aryl-alcohol dehydrogenase-like predicted oxidoreductase